MANSMSTPAASSGTGSGVAVPPSAAGLRDAVLATESKALGEDGYSLATLLEGDATEVLLRLGALRRDLENLARAAAAGEVQLPAAVCLVSALADADVPARIVASLDDLSFEAQKAATRVFGAWLWLASVAEQHQQVAVYLCGQRRLPQLMLAGCARAESCTHHAAMLGRCAGLPSVAARLLEAGIPQGLVELAGHQNFEVSSEAFGCLRELLLAHREETARYLRENFGRFFSLYSGLLEVSDYTTRRQAVRLLAELLLDPRLKGVMVEYVARDEFLQLHMNLLRDSSKVVQLEVFHVLKIFVANPRMPPRVQKILYRNRERLLQKLQALSAERAAEAMREDIATVCASLRALESSPAASPVLAPVKQPAPGPNEQCLNVALAAGS